MRENEDYEIQFIPPSEALNELARAIARIQQRFYAAVSPLYRNVCVVCGYEFDNIHGCGCQGSPQKRAKDSQESSGDSRSRA